MNRFIALPAIMLFAPIALLAHVLAVPPTAWVRVGRSRSQWAVALSLPAALGLAVVPFSAAGWVLVLAADVAVVAYLTKLRPLLSVAVGADRLERGLPVVEPWREWFWPFAVIVALSVAGLAIVVA